MSLFYHYLNSFVNRYSVHLQKLMDYTFVHWPSGS